MAKKGMICVFSRAVWGEPPKATSQQKGFHVTNGRVRVYTTAHVNNAKQSIAAQFAPFRPAKPYIGPVLVDVTFMFSHPKGHKKADKLLSMPKPTRPDLDNLVKLFLDAVSPMFFVDDGQVYHCCAEKLWSPKPGIVFHIYQDMSDLRGKDNEREKNL